MRRNLLGLGLTCLYLLAGPLAAGTRIVVDAGHGGADKGSVAGSQVEKDWTLKFSRALVQTLTGAGYDVMAVRVKDDTISGDKRFEILNTAGAAVALILHADRESTGKTRGPYFVVQPPQSGTPATDEGLPEAGSLPLGRYKQSLQLARQLATAVGVSPKFSPLSDPRALAGDVSSPDGRILAVPHQSLRYVALPAVVIEPLFITNPEDLQLYGTDAAIQAFAQKITQGLAAYLRGEGK